MEVIYRSPRISNHAVPVATLTHRQYVDLIGYRGNFVPQLIDYNHRIRIRSLSTKILKLIQKLPQVLFLLYAVLRILFQILKLCYVFLSESYHYILAQSPSPCVAVLFAMAHIKTLRLYQRTIIIAWNYYGYSIMRVNRGAHFHREDL